jgi:opacity protein-like surface antigen
LISSSIRAAISPPTINSSSESLFQPKTFVPREGLRLPGLKVPGKENLFMLKAACLGAALFLFAGLANAQVPTSGNIFFGYSFENATSTAVNLSDVTRPNLQGWEGSLEGKVLPSLGIVADFSGHYGSDQVVELTPDGPLVVSGSRHEEDVMFGPRFSFAVRKFRPFAEFEFGLGHVNTNGFGSDTSFAMALGGGLDYRIVRPLALRFQGDYVSTRFFGTTQNNVRLSTGIVFRF